jgi:hypothetical protein
MLIFIPPQKIPQQIKLNCTFCSLSHIIFILSEVGILTQAAVNMPHPGLILVVLYENVLFC